MQPETKLFLNCLFGRCHSGYITLSAIHPDGWHSTPSRHILVRDSSALDEALEKLISANQRNWGAYVGVAMRKGNLGRYHRGSRSDLADLSVLMVDIDKQPEFALRQLKEFYLPASCIIQTSTSSYHAYWWLDKPTQDFDVVDMLLANLAHHFHGDKLTTVQSMRLVGTLNTKFNQNFLCRLVEIHPERLYTLDDFHCCLKPHLVTSSPNRSPMQIESHNHLNFRLVQAVVDCLIRDYDAVQRPNGWLAACCPLPHHRDKRGSHFFFNPKLGLGYCFGQKHGGRILLWELCKLLHIPMWLYGGIYSK